ncbi:MAG TPA: hypothetical protein VM554_13945 [Acidisarcina sp.]|nr:hypothetical protein [Acidisarcina sp.]
MQFRLLSAFHPVRLLLHPWLRPVAQIRPMADCVVRCAASLCVATLLAVPTAVPTLAQQAPAHPEGASSSSSNGPAVDTGEPADTPAQSSSSSSRPGQEKAPALVDRAGPTISLQVSEALFTVAAGLNACGYDDELESSDPIRLRVRQQMDAVLQTSEEARTARDGLCAYISQHKLSSSSRDLAQYISLALYLTPPPELAPSVDLPELPPDSTQILEVLPLLRSFANTVGLHVVWAANRNAYEEQVAQLHDPLTKMILATNVYLKMPTSTYDGRRFLVVLEPMLAPGDINARIYASDYLVVASPVNGKIRMTDVRHAYLHYEIEPLLFSRASSTDRLLPILKTVREAPLDYVFRSDIVSLVVECLVRAIEARTMDTGIPEYKVPANVRRSDLERVDRERTQYQQKTEAIRQQSVRESMSHGYVLTNYFYDALKSFENDPASLKDSIGEMVYGMDVDTQIRRIKNIEFAQEGSQDVLRRSPRQLRGLDLAELKLIKGDTAAAADLAQKALAQHTSDAARANFILARCAILNRNTQDAVDRFEETIRVSKEPRMLAWSHIYLGRIYDINDRREDAVEEYKAALTVRDGQADTRLAAEKGLKEPWAVPQHKPAGNDAAPVAAKP